MNAGRGWAGSHHARQFTKSLRCEDKMRADLAREVERGEVGGDGFEVERGVDHRVAAIADHRNRGLVRQRLDVMQAVAQRVA